MGEERAAGLTGRDGGVGKGWMGAKMGMTSCTTSERRQARRGLDCPRCCPLLDQEMITW